MQDFPAALRGGESEFELLSDERTARPEFLLSHAPGALDLARLQHPVPLTRGLRALDPVRRVVLAGFNPLRDAKPEETRHNGAHVVRRGGRIARRIGDPIEQLSHIAALDGADRPVVPVRAKLGVDPVHVLFSGLFLLLAVPLDVLGGQLLEPHERRTVTDCDGRVPGRPDAIARGPQVHLGVAPQLGADQTSPRQASPPPPPTTGARGRRSSSRWGGRAPRGRWFCCRSIRRCAATA
jgi:hypothetical protein